LRFLEGKSMAERSTDSTFVVRAFAWEDWRSLWLVRLAQLAEEGVVLDPSEIPEQPQPDAGDEHGEWDLDHIGETYLRGAGNFWLAWCGDLPIGYVGGWDVGGVIELRWMYVRADYRRRGVGTALVRSLIAHSQAHGIPAIELWTGRDGLGRLLYHTLGFRQTAGPGAEFGDVPALTKHTPDTDEIRMRLDL